MENPFSIFNEQAKTFSGIAAVRNQDAREQEKLNLFAQNQAFSQAIEAEKLGMLQDSHVLDMKAKDLNIRVARQNMRAAGLRLDGAQLKLAAAERAQEEQTFTDAFRANLPMLGADRITSQEEANDFISRIEKESAAELAAFPSARAALREAVTDQLARHGATVAGLSDKQYDARLINMDAQYTDFSTKLDKPVEPWVREALLDKRHPKHAEAYAAVRQRIDEHTQYVARSQAIAVQEGRARFANIKQTFTDGNVSEVVVTETDKSLELALQQGTLEIPMGEGGKLVKVNRQNWETMREFIPQYYSDADLPKLDAAMGFVPAEAAQTTVRVSDFQTRGADPIRARAEAFRRAEALTNSGQAVRFVDIDGNMILVGPPGAAPSEEGGGETGPLGEEEAGAWAAPPVKGTEKPEGAKASPMIDLPALVKEDASAVSMAGEISKMDSERRGKIKKAQDAYDAYAAKVAELKRAIAQLSGPPRGAFGGYAAAERAMPDTDARLLGLYKSKVAGAEKELNRLKAELDKAKTSG